MSRSNRSVGFRPDIDSKTRGDEVRVVRHWLSLLFALAAVVGLLGQEAALAHAAPAVQTEERLSASHMSSDCAEMMDSAKQAQPSKPCTSMTFDCIAKMGCVAMIALLPDRALGAPPPIRAAVPDQRAVEPLFGQDTGPDPHPPASLG